MYNGASEYLNTLVIFYLEEDCGQIYENSRLTVNYGEKIFSLYPISGFQILNISLHKNI